MKLSQKELSQINEHRERAKHPDLKEDYITTITSPLMVKMVIMVIENEISKSYHDLQPIWELGGVKGLTKEELRIDLKSNNIDPLIREKKIWESHYQKLKNPEIELRESSQSKRSKKQKKSFQLKNQEIIRLLYFYMIGTFIDDNTSIDQFENAFNGKPFTHPKIDWNEGIILLAYFIDQIANKDKLNLVNPCNRWATAKNIFNNSDSLKQSLYNHPEPINKDKVDKLLRPFMV